MTGARALVGFGRAVMRGRGPPGRVLRPFPNPSAHPRSLVLADLAGAGLAETNASLRLLRWERFSTTGSLPRCLW